MSTNSDDAQKSIEQMIDLISNELSRQKTLYDKMALNLQRSENARALAVKSLDEATKSTAAEYMKNVDLLVAQDYLECECRQRGVQLGEAIKEIALLDGTVNACFQALADRASRIAAYDAEVCDLKEDVAKLEVGYLAKDVECDTARTVRDVAVGMLKSAVRKKTALSAELDAYDDALKAQISEACELENKVAQYKAVEAQREAQRLSDEQLFNAFKKEFFVYTEGTENEVEFCAGRAVGLVKDKNLHVKKVLPFVRALSVGSLKKKGFFGRLADLFSTRERVFNIEHAMSCVLNKANNDNLDSLLNDVLYKRQIGCSPFELACAYA